jgi:hypothetical protein
VRLDEHVLYDVVHVSRTADELQNDGSHVGRIAAEHVVEAKGQGLTLVGRRWVGFHRAASPGLTQKIPEVPA